MKHLLLTSIIVLTSAFSGLSQSWEYDLSVAKTKASDSNKRIIVVFQGSDWCAPCIKLDKEIWSTEEFKSLAKEEFIMLKADFPRKKKNKLSDAQQTKNNELAEKFNAQGYFPYVLVINSDEKILGSTGYKKITPKEYFNLLNSFK